jgi:hypothetical protein
VFSVGFDLDVGHEEKVIEQVMLFLDVVLERTKALS